MIQEAEIFECQQCGHCCQGETTVSLNESDVNRMLAYLEIPRAEVAGKYWRLTDDIIQMKIVDGHCVFFDQGCTVHTGKPWRCKQWPLHPSILSDEANFQAIKASCPGINQDVSYRNFCRKLSVILNNPSN